MNTEILAFGAPGILEAMLVTVLMALSCILPVVVVIYVIRLLIRNKQENQRLRLEVGKLADELERMRKQNESKSPAAPAH
ncbi:unnamed protein product [marine sediment metagenome]|uniref:Uncharacterized protein n=1 Tax=marine sediment metagenome TaxID=412755 RepID=X1EZH0_9ZZZZ